MVQKRAASQWFSEQLRELDQDQIDSEAGFFQPDTIFWQVNRESALFLGGMRALLLQLAHPKVAQGVAEHSRFTEDPLGRAHRTFETVHTWIFGSRAEALKAAAKVYGIHMRVRGEVLDPPTGLADPAYHAIDPRLLQWVYTTLVDSALQTYELVYRPLSPAEREQYYQESRRAALLGGIDATLLPADHVAFRQWFEQMVASDEISVTPTARLVARSLFRGSPLALLTAPLNYILAAGMLPPKVRAGFGLAWNPPLRFVYMLVIYVTRIVFRLLPPAVRVLPAARRAEQRYQQRSAAAFYRRTSE